MGELLLEIRRQGETFDWRITSIGGRTGGIEVSIADCLQAGASAALVRDKRTEIRIAYRSRFAGPYPAARLLMESNELADHLMELALER